MVTVVMTEDALGEQREVWRSGLTYTASPTFAARLIGRGMAYDPAGSVTDVGGGGGGAAAFTDLTDAPATITAGALMVGNPEGDAVAFTDNLTWDGDAKILMLTTDDSNGGQLGATSETGSGRAAVYADNTYASVVCNASVPLGAAGSILLEAYADGTAGLTMGEGDFFMAGFDVAATDAAATMTVDAVEYSIAKAIKVKIGSDTYFWPLFGPVAP